METKAQAPSIYVGTSGWIYRHWGGGVFYPPGLKQKDWLRYYSGNFNTVEINFTFYRLPEESAFAEWAASVPSGFIFSVKANRFITHMKKLKETEQPMERLLSRAARLGQHLGPILFQFPSRWQANLDRLRELLSYLDQQKIAPGISPAFEFRNQSWLVPEVFSAIEDAGGTVCLVDWGEFVVEGPDIGPFAYIRRHGPKYGYSYSTEDLARDADLICRLAEKGKTVYVYFNNDAAGAAVRDARRLVDIIGRKR